MIDNNRQRQRETYKLLERISSRKYPSEIELLESLVKEIVENPDYEMSGGRVWQLDPENRKYVLKYQNGHVKTIPPAFSVSIDKDDVKNLLTTLSKKRVLHDKETDAMLLDLGIKHYSVTGAGEVIRLFNGKFFQFLLSFNAEQYSESFDETLSVISSVATVAIRNLTSEKQQQKYKRDIKKASEIQRSLFPDHDLDYLDYKVYGVCIPDSEVGGDYFDYIKQIDKDGQERLSIIVSDAASKGLPAAIQALFVSGALRMGLSFASRISHVLSMLNTLIFKTFPLERFVTLFYCELTRASNRMVLYANCGHCPPVLYRRRNDEFRLLEATGGLLGIAENQSFDVENVIMKPGDILVLFSDGITEAQNMDGDLYGEDRLMKIIRNNKDEESKVIALQILEDVQKFSAMSTYTDDKTLVVIKRDQNSKPFIPIKVK